MPCGERRERRGRKLHRNEPAVPHGCGRSRGDALPAEYVGQAWSCEPTGNLVHYDALEPSGGTFHARRVRDNSEAVRSRDDWFRPVFLADGPDGAEQLDAIIVATGSEVAIAIDARTALTNGGLSVRVVSMPCREWFAAQPLSYRDSVLPPSVRVRVSVEAATGQGWRDVVGDAGRIVSLERFGASADHRRLYREFGITPGAVADAVRDSIRDAAGPIRPGGHQQRAAPTTGGTGDRPE